MSGRRRLEPESAPGKPTSGSSLMARSSASAAVFAVMDGPGQSHAGFHPKWLEWPAELTKDTDAT